MNEWMNEWIILLSFMFPSVLWHCWLDMGCSRWCVPRQLSSAPWKHSSSRLHTVASYRTNLDNVMRHGSIGDALNQLLIWFDLLILYMVRLSFVYKTKDNLITRFSCSALTLYIEWQEGYPSHKNPVVIPVSFFFVKAPAHPGYPGSKGRKMVVGYWLSVDNCNCITRMLFKGTYWSILTFHSPFLSIVTMSFVTVFNKRTWWWWWWYLYDSYQPWFSCTEMNRLILGVYVAIFWLFFCCACTENTHSV